MSKVRRWPDYQPPEGWDEYPPQSPREELGDVLGRLVDEAAIQAIVKYCEGWEGVIELLDRLYAGDEKGFWQEIDNALEGLDN
jgi:hypothetical protein